LIIRYQGSPIKPSTSNSKPAAQKAYSKPSPNFQRKAPAKKESVETTQKNEIKAMFMNWFKIRKAVAGHIMSKQDVITYILKKIDSKQDRPFQIAMDELKNDGIIEIKEDGVTLVLTQKGSERI
jgi:hypothetical protein